MSVDPHLWISHSSALLSILKTPNKYPQCFEMKSWMCTFPAEVGQASCLAVSLILAASGLFFCSLSAVLFTSLFRWWFWFKSGPKYSAKVLSIVPEKALMCLKEKCTSSKHHSDIISVAAGNQFIVGQQCLLNQIAFSRNTQFGFVLIG